MQETCKGQKKQAIAYYSIKLDDMAQGYLTCYQGLAAVHYVYEKASTMMYPVIIYTHHKVSELIEQGKFVLTPARVNSYRMLLTYPDIGTKVYPTVNIADTIP